MNKLITKPVSKTISNQDMICWLLGDICNVFCWLALKENWGKILVAIGNSKSFFTFNYCSSIIVTLTFPIYTKKLMTLTN